MNYTAYEKILIKDAILLLIVCVIAIIGVCLTFPHIRKLNEMRGLLTVLSVLLILGSVTLVFFTAFDTLYDINKKAYVVYEGEFRADKSTVYLLDEKKTLEISDSSIEGGEHIGRIVYGEKTERVVDFEIYK